MSISSISSIDGTSSDLGIYDDFGKVEELAKKTQSIWGKIYDAVTGYLIRVVHIIRNAIGSVVRDLFFFPLKCPMILKRPEVQNQINIEETYYRNFWDPTKPLDPNFIDQAQIREKFALPVDKVIPIQLKNGKMAEITCRIMETKASAGEFYNFVQISGIHATNSNNIAAISPYLGAYLNSKQTPLPPARFITVCANNLHFKPDTLDEAGLAILEAIKGLKREFGQIDQLVAHSLGTVFLANALSQLDDPDSIPKHICFDRGPTSTREVSKKYFGGLGSFLYLLAKIGGWVSDTELEIVHFYEKWSDRTSLFITGVEQDHHFSKTANLCSGEKIKQLEGIDRATFDPPMQTFHEHAGHNLNPHYLNAVYLTEPSNFLNPSENLAEAIIRHSLAKACH